ncbi:STAS domain-containing protein [Cryptosporangium aurantiacum]|uniref:Anti-sigma factor antagonist n=1 Tax=Cryptosporangium aurantiacum TaxID=134849 RepID=A0A1M7RLV6_9ACTN|nr:STAS domain-containing protein [Cryptosporangium aurantiacum]SHN47160.1 anti-sigma B factor antagonist [Cryptosporangium aurantiacum]
MKAHLTTDTRTTTAGPVLSLAGELDHATAPQVHAALLELRLTDGQQLTIDMSGVTFCDSSGIGSLLAAHAYAAQAHGVFVLSAVPARTRYLLGVVGLDLVLPMFPTADEALDAWSGDGDSPPL